MGEAFPQNYSHDKRTRIGPCTRADRVPIGTDRLAIRWIYAELREIQERVLAVVKYCKSKPRVKVAAKCVHELRQCRMFGTENMENESKQ